MTVSSSPKGSAFVRLAIASAVAKGDMLGAGEYAAARWGEGSAALRVIKASVGAGTTNNGNWAGDLAGDRAAAAMEFMGLVRQQSIVGRLTGLRRVPSLTPLMLQTGGATAAWVKEGSPMPVSAMSFKRESLSALKVAAMCVVTVELLRSTDPWAEAFIRNDLVRAVAEASDAAFIDPANAGSDGETPASVTYGVTAQASTGQFALDVKKMIASFSGDLLSAYFVGRPELLAQIAGTEFPNVGARGGEILGIPALASRGVPNDGSGNYTLTLIDPTGIAYVAEDAQAEVKASSQGAVQMSDDPSASPTGANLVSLWQVDAVAIAALLRENWKVNRTGSVAQLTGIVPIDPEA